MESMEQLYCIICNKSDQDDLCEIKAGTIERLVRVSKERGDKKHVKMEKLKSITVHKNVKLLT